MLEHNIDIYLLQETWLTGDWITNIANVTTIHHGPDEPASNRGSGGIAIMLGPRAQRAWKAAGSPDPYRPGLIVDNTTRYMGVDLVFHPRKNQTAKFFIGNVYSPYSEMENTQPGIISKFYETVETHLTQLPPDVDPILGGDFNASVGIRQDTTDHVLGPYGIPHSNNVGEKLIDMARNCSLQASATYFKSRQYETFYDLRNNRAPRQLDLIFVHQKQGPNVTDARVFQPRNNIVSDHHATRLKLRLARNLSKSKRKKQDSTDNKADPINWSLLHRNEQKRQEYADQVETILHEFAVCTSNEATPTQLSEDIMYAAEATITQPKHHESNWFDASESIVQPLRDAAQRAYKKFLAEGTEANKCHWHFSRRRYHRVQCQAKKRYFNQIAVRASEKAMRRGPREAWEAVRILRKGSTAHH